MQGLTKAQRIYGRQGQHKHGKRFEMHKELLTASYDAWAFLMHVDHGWFARHQFTTVTLVLAIAVFAPGAIACI